MQFSSEQSGWLWKEPVVVGDDQTCSLLGWRVLGDSLRALADGVLGQLTRKQQTNGRLDFAARDRRAPVVVSQSRRLARDALKDVVHEAVHDAHSLAADSSVWMNLLQHFVHVDGVALTSPVLPLLVSTTSSLRLARCFFGSFGSLRCWFRCHSLTIRFNQITIENTNSIAFTTVKFSLIKAAAE